MCVPLLTATGKFFMSRDARAYLWDVQIIAFRNVLIHGYADLDHERVWHEAAQGLPRLSLAINLLLAEAGPPNTPYP